MIRRFKLHFASVLTAALPLLAACTDAYPGIDYDYGDGDGMNNTETYDETPLMVFINEQDFFSISATRVGTGAMEEDNLAGWPTWAERLKNSNLYFYAFRSSKDAQGPIKEEPDFRTTLADEIAAGNQSNEDHAYKDCLLDGSVMGDVEYGMLGRIRANEGDDTNKNSGKIVWDGGKEFFYSAKYQDVGFNFFGYFLDKESPSAKIVRDKDSIYYENFEIDGAMDVMCGIAPKLTRELVIKKRPILEAPEYENEVNKIVNIGGYSTYAAHRQVFPEIGLKHILTRMKFQAYAASEELTTDSSYVVIQGISVKSPYKGNLVVASKNTSRIGFHTTKDSTFLVLRDTVKAGEEYGSDKFDIEINYNEALGDNQKKYRIGESLMLVPGEKYKMELSFIQYIKQKDGTFRPFYMKTTYDFYAPLNDKNFWNEETGKYEFLAGKYYVINIGVYGVEKVRISATINEWEDGGNVDVDPDGDNDDNIVVEGFE